MNIPLMSIQRGVGVVNPSRHSPYTRDAGKERNRRRAKEKQRRQAAKRGRK